MDFKQVKSEILELTRHLETAQLIPIKQARTEKDLIRAIKLDIDLLVSNYIVTVKNLERWFGVEFLDENQIYTCGTRCVDNFDNSQVVALGEARLTIATIARNISTIRAYDSSTIVIHAYGDSSTIVTMKDNSSINIVAWNNSVTVIRMQHQAASIESKIMDETATVIIN